MITDTISTLQAAFLAAIDQASSVADLEAIEQEYFGRKQGKMTEVMKSLKALSGEEKKAAGQAANVAKQAMMAAYMTKVSQLQEAEITAQLVAETIDVTQPALDTQARVGHVHPIIQARLLLEDVVQRMGFRVEDGPELESDYYVFEGLNFPEHHPARESMDTFYIKDHEDLMMRAHVSNMQVRMMRKYGAPLRIAYPGRVYRNEALDATHEHTFDQFEAFVVGEDISIAHLIATLKELLRGIYGKEMPIRLRPGYFPFVEPGFELDIQYTDSTGQTKWLEMLGCGLIHPNVLRAGGIDPETHSGFAFGMGIDRLVMLKYGIEDVRHFRSGDLRFLSQF